MPLYDFKCPKCDHIEEEYCSISERNNPVFCCDCGEQMERFYMRTSIGVFEPITLEHIADEPMTFNTKRELKDYCKKHGLSSGALL